MRNIIYAVETGGQIYGNNRYSDFTEAYTNSDSEHAITIGAGAWLGVEAKKLLCLIREKAPTMFFNLDTEGIGKDLDAAAWSTYKVSKTSAKANCIVMIIDSTTGHQCQDRLLDEQMEVYIKEAAELGVEDVAAQCMCANFRHQGGKSAMKRVIAKTPKPYTLDGLYEACKTDIGNQVGAYRSRQSCVYSWLKKYMEEEKGENHMISNCGHDENNRYSGGIAGDQTGSEWALINWYNRPWGVMLRHPNPTVQAKVAELATKAAQNNLIGYDQNQRYTFWEHLKASNYDPAQITIKCEADCSSGVAAIVKAVGYLLNDEKLKQVSIYCYTGNLRAALVAAGFVAYTASKYLTGSSHLLPGDILLNESHHVATNITKGANATNGSTGSVSTPMPSATGRIDTVAEVQSWLNSNFGSDLAVDNSYGRLTKAALVKALQRTLGGLDVDGSFGNLTRAKVKVLKKGSTGTLVKILQALLVCNGYSSAYVDGDFGSGTDSAVRSYQGSKGLAVDGEAGKNTFSVLCK